MRFPKIIFIDLEGTLLKKDTSLDNKKVAPSAWTVLAKMLGEECYVAEELTKDKWLRGEYSGYLDWMKDTVELHIKYGLTKYIFDDLLNHAEVIPNTDKAIDYFKFNGAITAIVTGGFKGLSDKVQKKLKIDHAFSGCEYFFDQKTNMIEHYNLLPADELGKVGFMNLIIKEHGFQNTDCAFIGDGKNDVHLAKNVGFSVAFNAQEELRSVAHTVIDQPPGKEDWSSVIDVFRKKFE